MRIVDVVFVYQLRSPELVRWHSRRHSHPEPQYELHYFLSGDGGFENGGDRYRIEHGSLFLAPPGTIHAVVPGELHRPVSYYAVLFAVPDSSPLRRVVETRQFQRSFPRTVGSRHRVLFEELANRYAHVSRARHHAGVHMLQALLWDLEAERGTGGDTPGELAAHGDPDAADYNVHVDRAIQLFERHVARPITVAEVARRLEISQAHLTRLFDQRFGVPPLQYYRRLRMEVAASRLINTTSSVKEIAWELGYSNPFHFSRSFKRFAEMSPIEYRRQYYRTAPTGYAGRLVDRPDDTDRREA